MDRETYPLLSFPVTSRLAIKYSKFKADGCKINTNKNTNLGEHSKP